MPFYFPVAFILRNERRPEVLPRQLVKACPNTNKGAGRNALLAT